MLLRIFFLTGCILAFGQMPARAQAAAHEICPRPAPGSAVPEPQDLRSQNGVLKVELAYRKSVDSNGRTRYCYVYQNGSEAPTLRLKPGDLLVLDLKNDVHTQKEDQAQLPGVRNDSEMHGACTHGKMTSESTNLHFHGLTVPPVCHQDDVLKTMIQPGDPPFEYRFRIPSNEPPGLYWYHPHVHGLTTGQVLGGASGALIVEGIERANRDLAGLPERVFVIRDEDLRNSNAVQSNSASAQMPPVVLDHDGDALNTGTGTGKPAKDLSINFVPVSYPDYSPALIAMKPGERQLWRVLNASALTYLNLEVVFNDAAQSLGVVAVDGVPINENGMAGSGILWQNHLGLPPGGRIEFIVAGPSEGTKASFVT